MTIGIAGGGQLGRMLTEAAHLLGHTVTVLDPTPNSPAAQVADEHIVGDYKDEKMMLALAEKSDVVTYEIESVNAHALETLAENGKAVHPVPHTLSIIKDKLKQKTFLRERGIPVADFIAVSDEASGYTAGEILKYPFILKSRTGGFDGRGNALITKPADMSPGIKKIFGSQYDDISSYAEKFVPFEKELAIVAARTVGGEVTVFPLVETIHRDHICHMTLAPAPVSKDVAEKAHNLAEKVLKAFSGAGVFGIEMFLSQGEVLVNEIAPRVHNSGHWTVEGCETSQFEQHVRAITGESLGSVAMQAPAAVMVNILGERNSPAEPRGITEAEAIQGVHVHIYGKMETRMQRKMGHITALANTLEEARANAEKARGMISI